MKHPLERSLQQAVLRRLEKLRQSDATLIYRKRHGTVSGTAGDPDLYGVWRGIHFELELKRVGAEPTELQAARLRQWAAAGACGWVVHTLAELDAALAELATLARCT